MALPDQEEYCLYEKLVEGAVYRDDDVWNDKKQQSSKDDSEINTYSPLSMRRSLPTMALSNVTTKVLTV